MLENAIVVIAVCLFIIMLLCVFALCLLCTIYDKKVAKERRESEDKHIRKVIQKYLEDN